MCHAHLLLALQLSPFAGTCAVYTVTRAAKWASPVELECLLEKDVALLGPSSDRRFLLRVLFSTVKEFSTATTPKPRGRYLVSPSGVGKSRLAEAFVSAVPNFFPGVASVLLDGGASTAYPALHSLRPVGKKLVVVIDNMEKLYNNELHLPLLREAVAELEQCVHYLIIGVGSDLVLRNLLLVKNVADVEKWKNFGQVPKFNRRKFRRLPGIFNVVAEDEFNTLAHHIAPEPYSSWDKQRLMWLAGGNADSIDLALNPWRSQEEETDFISNLENLFQDILTLNDQDRMAYKKAMRVIAAANVGRWPRLSSNFKLLKNWTLEAVLNGKCPVNPLSLQSATVNATVESLERLCFRGLLTPAVQRSVVHASRFLPGRPILLPLYITNTLQSVNLPDLLGEIKERVGWTAPMAGALLRQ